jgi:hypothetical protein
MSDIYLGFLKLINKGPRVRGVISGEYFHRKDMSPVYGRTGLENKKFNTTIFNDGDPVVKLSKDRQGLNYQRGAN